MNQALELDGHRPLLTLNARGRSLSDVQDAIRQAADKHGVEMLALDSISRAGMGDLTENRPVNTIADTLNRLAPTWVGIAHSPRADSTHIYGSVFFDAAADVLVNLSSERTETEVGVVLRVTKANDITFPAPMCLAYQFDPDVGLVGIRKATVTDFPELSNPTLADELEGYLLTEAGEDYSTHIAEVLGKNRSAIASILGKDARFTITKRQGHRTYYGLKADPVFSG